MLATTGTRGILGYQGDITDAATKQVDMGTRWYAPGQGRFTSRDVLFGELSSPMTLNQFAYAGGNPITMRDPTGMRPTCRPECDSDTEKDITDDYSDTANEGDGGYTCNCYDPSPPPPDPALAITYIREAGDYAVTENRFFNLDALDAHSSGSSGSGLSEDDRRDCKPIIGCELGTADEWAVTGSLLATGYAFTRLGKKMLKAGDRRGYLPLGLGLLAGVAGACHRNQTTGNLDRYLEDTYCEYRDEDDP